MEEVFKVAFRNLSHQKARTALTLLGVVVGIAAVVALISLGNGLSSSVTNQLKQLGTDNIIITPKMSAGFSRPTTSQALSDKDLKAIENVRGVTKAIALLSVSLPVKYKDESYYGSLMGLPSGDAQSFFTDLQNYKLEEGRFLQSGDKNVVVIGSRVHSEIFSGDVRLRDKLDILGHDVTVVGILQSTGNSQSDNAVLMPISTLQDITGNPDEITFIFAKTNEDPKTVAQRIETSLEHLHNNEKLFTVYTSDQLIAQVTSVFGVISIILIGIAGISLIVASFGIMNTMLMAVIERTREIGIMKAIGATNKTVLSLFMIESAFVGTIGGAVGIVLGYVFSFGFATVASSMFGMAIQIQFDPILVIGVMAFSTIVGLISGTYPAYRAAKLNPVEALRHE